MRQVSAPDGLHNRFHLSFFNPALLVELTDLPVAVALYAIGASPAEPLQRLVTRLTQPVTEVVGEAWRTLTKAAATAASC